MALGDDDGSLAAAVEAVSDESSPDNGGGSSSLPSGGSPGSNDTGGEVSGNGAVEDVHGFDHEAVASLQSILDGISLQQAVNLLKLSEGDVEMAIAMYFDGGSPATPPSELEEGLTESLAAGPTVLGNRVLEAEGDASGLYENGDAGPVPPSPLNGHPQPTRGRRRPGTAPAHRPPEDPERFAPKAEAIRIVLGSDLDNDTVARLLRRARGDVQVAIEMYLDGEEGHQPSTGDENGGFVLVEEPVNAGAGSGRFTRSSSNSAIVDSPRMRNRRGTEPAGPRRPYRDLAALLGNGVKAGVLAPILVETQGDVSKAVEIYCERAADPTAFAAMLAECKDEDISPTSEHYYLRPEEGVPVVCNVYDLSWGAEEKEGGKKKKVNSGLPGMGFGIYHSGIEVYGREISFGYSDDGSTGVFEVPAGCAGGVMPRIAFKEGVFMGRINRSRYEVDHLLARLADEYPGDSYDLVRRNCNHFANELCLALVGKKIPSYINRPANFGRAALNLIAVPALAIGKIVEGVKKVQGGDRRKDATDARGQPVVEAPNAVRLVEDTRRSRNASSSRRTSEPFVADSVDARDARSATNDAA